MRQLMLKMNNNRKLLEFMKVIMLLHFLLFSIILFVNIYSKCFLIITNIIFKDRYKGTGKIICPFGDIYEGDMLNGKANGRGSFTSSRIKYSYTG